MSFCTGFKRPALRAGRAAQQGRAKARPGATGFASAPGLQPCGRRERTQSSPGAPSSQQYRGFRVKAPPSSEPRSRSNVWPWGHFVAGSKLRHHAIKQRPKLGRVVQLGVFANDVGPTGGEVVCIDPTPGIKHDLGESESFAALGAFDLHPDRHRAGDLAPIQD
jgi:hypothetical protein